MKPCQPLSSLLLAASLLLPVAHAANQDPLVLVHGFAGWGRDELLGYKHFGGFYDIEAELKQQGMHTVTPAVGPFSSNWDRSAELYAQLKGGCVDYGAAHAAQYNHARYGRCYSTPLLPQWDDQHKAHLIAHSQGAQTSRMLVQLLSEGSAAERAATGADTSALFSGGRHWVKSVSTISGANNGTSLPLVISSLVPLAQSLVFGVAGAMGVSFELDAVYDFKLDQWGLHREPGETLSSYFDRMSNSAGWQLTGDISSVDLSPDGAAEINQWVKTQPDVYYFSWSNRTSYAGWLTDYHYPQLETNPLLSANVYALGSYSRIAPPGKVTIDKSWYANDGVVNTISMAAPFGQPRTNYNASQPAQPGVWNFMGEKSNWDHWDAIGVLGTASKSEVVNFYSNQARLVRSLN